MLNDYVRPEQPSKEDVRERVRTEQSKLSTYGMKIKEAKLPVMVIFEGWGSSGKGSAIANVIKNIDPRFFQVATMDKPATPDELRKPFLYRYFIEIPEAGKFKFYDSFWMNEVTRDRIEGRLNDEDYEKRIRSINVTERQLTDNGYLVMKFFFHISRKEQKKRLQGLLADKNTRWRVSDADLQENKHYDKYLAVYDKYLKDTDRSQAPWYIIDASNRKWAELQVLSYLNLGIETAMKNQSLAVPILQNTFPLKHMPLLSEVALDKSLTDEEYKERLDELQAELHDLHNKLYRKKIPVVIAYEGWDAAGKGGNIKRITGALDPRGYTVHPIASPEPHEKARHYLWRFWNRLPKTGHIAIFDRTWYGRKTGHIAIFDRTWYGRVMVERLEGFCSENDWQRAYNEMNEFEKELADWGAVVIKFWVQIDNQTQLDRFTDRLGCCRDQILGTDRQPDSARSLHGPPEYPGEAVEDHGRGLAEPR